MDGLQVRAELSCAWPQVSALPNSPAHYQAALIHRFWLNYKKGQLSASNSHFLVGAQPLAVNRVLSVSQTPRAALCVSLH